jgi:hypothetical protein
VYGLAECVDRGAGLGLLSADRGRARLARAEHADGERTLGLDSQAEVGGGHADRVVQRFGLEEGYTVADREFKDESPQSAQHEQREE